MAIQSKCSRCGRFVGGDSCCGEIKKVKIERRKETEEDEFKAKPDAGSLAEALFGPGGELVEEEVEEDDEPDSDAA